MGFTTQKSHPELSASGRDPDLLFSGVYALICYGNIIT